METTIVAAEMIVYGSFCFFCAAADAAVDVEMAAASVNPFH